MTPPPRRYLAAAVSVAVLFGAAGYVPAGLDVWNVPSLRAQLAAEDLRQIDLETRQSAVARLSSLKRWVATEVVTGRQTLAGAAAVYGELHADGRDVALFRRTYKESSDRACLARNVAAFVDVVLVELNHPDADDVRCRVAAELDACR